MYSEISVTFLGDGDRDGVEQTDRHISQKILFQILLFGIQGNENIVLTKHLFSFEMKWFKISCKVIGISRHIFTKRKDFLIDTKKHHFKMKQADNWLFENYGDRASQSFKIFAPRLKVKLFSLIQQIKIFVYRLIKFSNEACFSWSPQAFVFPSHSQNNN